MYRKDQVHRVTAKPGDIVVIDYADANYAPIEVALGPDEFAPSAEFRVLLWDRKLEVIESNNGVAGSDFAPDRFFYEFRG